MVYRGTEIDTEQHDEETNIKGFFFLFLDTQGGGDNTAGGRVVRLENFGEIFGAI